MWLAMVASVDLQQGHMLFSISLYKYLSSYVHRHVLRDFEAVVKRRRQNKGTSS